MFRIVSGGRVQIAIPEATGEVEAISLKTVSPEVWTPIAGVFDGTSLKVYLNGTLDRTTPAPKPPQGSTGPLFIGRSAGGGGNNFLGGIDDVRIYNRALSTEEIARLAQGK